MAVSLRSVVNKASSLVVIAPHPDDDVLGCGTLLAYAAERIPVAVVYVTDGAASHVGSPTYPPDRLRALREDEAMRGLLRLGVRTRARFLRWPDGAVPSCEGAGAATLMDALRACIANDADVAVAVPWRRDPHADHRAVASLVDAVLSERPRATRIEYTVWLDVRGEDGDAPTAGEGRLVELDSRPWLGAKRAAIGEHRSQAGRLITDAAEAFAFPAALIAAALGPVERYVVAP